MQLLFLLSLISDNERESERKESPIAVASREARAANLEARCNYKLFVFDVFLETSESGTRVQHASRALE